MSERVTRRKLKSTNYEEKEIENAPKSTRNAFYSVYIDKIYEKIPQRYHSLTTRSVVGFFFLLLLFIIKTTGVVGMILFISFVVIQCYRELISVGYNKYKNLPLPLFRFFQWYFLFSAYFFTSGDLLVKVITAYLKQKWIYTVFLQYHGFTSFSFYILGIIIFVLNLRKGKYKLQFKSFAWYHMALLVLMIPSQLLLRSMFYGKIWIFLPMLLITINDIFAYFFGIAFGRTPLIKLSPKKTWEGFIGGALSTMIGAILICNWLMPHPSLHCPVEFDSKLLEFVTVCEKASTFKLQTVKLNPIIRNIFKILGIDFTSISFYPMQIHAIIMGLFASLISPFGGFFASGFKRAFKVKDFGDSIPGHGGMMDRMDCQILMSIFVNIYIHSFIKTPATSRIVSDFMKLSDSQRIEVFKLIQKMVNTSIDFV